MILLAIAGFLSAISGCANETISADAPIRSLETAKEDGQTPTHYDLQILELINEHRLAMGLPDLAIDPIVQVQASKHSSNMALAQVPFGHGGFQSRAQILLRELRGSGVAENVALGQPSARSVVTAWLASPSHRVNIEGNYMRTGLSAIRNASGKWYYTQMFWRP